MGVWVVAVHGMELGNLLLLHITAMGIEVLPPVITDEAQGEGQEEGRDTDHVTVDR
jgi:hypothetical protein